MSAISLRCCVPASEPIKNAGFVWKPIKNAGFVGKPIKNVLSRNFRKRFFAT